MKTEYVIISLVVALATGVFIGAIFKKEKIKVETKVEEKIIEKEKVVEVIKEVEVEKKVYINEKKVLREVIKPDGTIIKEEIYETNKEQIDRLRQDQEAKTATLEKENKLLRAKLVERTNPKRLSVFVGYNNNNVVGGANYSLFGPVTFGALYTDNMIVPTIGITF